MVLAVAVLARGSSANQDLLQVSLAITRIRDRHEDGIQVAKGFYAKEARGRRRDRVKKT
jgi:hypothetical protein